MELKYKTQVKTYTLKVADSNNVEEISNPELLFKIVKKDFNPIQEEIYLLILNTRHTIIDKIMIARGALGQVAIQPADVLRQVLLTNGNRFILAHNHPSGNATPSEEDIFFTRKISKASEICGLLFLDHIIYTDKEYTSFKKN